MHMFKTTACSFLISISGFFYFKNISCFYFVNSRIFHLPVHLVFIFHDACVVFRSTFMDLFLPDPSYARWEILCCNNEC